MNSQQRNKVLHVISYDHKNRSKLFLELEEAEQVRVLLSLSRHVQYQLLRELNDEQVVRLTDLLDPDAATDIIRLLSKKRQEFVVQKLSKRLRQVVATLLNFDPETAAGVMSVNYIQVETAETIGNIAKLARKHERRTGKLPTILVVDNGKLKGELPGHELAFAKPRDTASDFVRKVRSIKHDTRHRKVISYFKNNPHSKVVVVGDSKQVIGVIYTDDILRLIQSHEAASLYEFAGVSDEESIFDPIYRKVKFRYKWLIANLVTAFLAAFTVGLFDEVISRNILLAIYMPIVAGMGGNAGTQTLAVMVRGLSKDSIGTRTILQALKNEMVSGVVNGVINGAIVIGVVYLLNRDLLVGAVLALAMIINLFVAGTFGTLVPVLMKRLGKDPASSATIFITTATDVFGFMAFLGIATLLLV